MTKTAQSVTFKKQRVIFIQESRAVQESEMLVTFGEYGLVVLNV